MSLGKRTALFVLVLFVPFTLWALATGGSLGEVAAAFTINPWHMQVGIDLVLALSMVCVWLWNDARSRGANPIPWIVTTALTGSIAPLVYLLVRPADDA